MLPAIGQGIRLEGLSQPHTSGPPSVRGLPFRWRATLMRSRPASRAEPAAGTPGPRVGGKGPAQRKLRPPAEGTRPGQGRATAREPPSHEASAFVWLRRDTTGRQGRSSFRRPDVTLSDVCRTSSPERPGRQPSLSLMRLAGPKARPNGYRGWSLAAPEHRTGA